MPHRSALHLLSTFAVPLLIVACQGPPHESSKHEEAQQLAKGTGPAEAIAGFTPLYDSEDKERQKTEILSEFECSDPKAWQSVRPATARTLELRGASKYRPKLRSPRSLALLRGKRFGSFVLDVEVQQTGREYGHRDLCFFFGAQDAGHFYYAHIASRADPHAHGIFVVDGKPRVKIAEPLNKGIDWGRDEWHHVRIFRNAVSGLTRVYFDDMDSPILEAVDQRFRDGRVGLGSFDDTGLFRKLRIRGAALGHYAQPFFTKAPTPKAGSSSAPLRIRKTKRGYELRFGSELFTELRLHQEMSPVLYPVFARGSVPMTRAFPLAEARPGETKDHPHHRSLWFGHGDVNGHDFWSCRNGERIVTRAHGLLTDGDSPIGVWLSNDWLDPKGKRVCQDRSELRFREAPGGLRSIDWQISLTASDAPLRFGDTKEGTMAIRMQGKLRLEGSIAAGTAMNSAGQHGKIIWGKRARWVAYSAPTGQGKHGLALLDHPRNPGHPCHWHARAYGLLAANPFGVSQFQGRRKRGPGVTLRKGSTLTFRYRFLFFSGKANAATLDRNWLEFAKRA